jgi:hypothetical protein
VFSDDEMSMRLAVDHLAGIGAPHHVDWHASAKAFPQRHGASWSEWYRRTAMIRHLCPCELSSGCDVLVPKVEFVLPAAKKKSGWVDIGASPPQAGRETASVPTLGISRSCSVRKACR